MKVLRPSWAILRWCAHCIGSFALWTFWLLLTAFLILQLVVALSQKLTIPTRIVRSFEDRLAIAGVRMTFDSASIDSRGRVLVENVRVFGEGFKEPLAACDALILHLDPWALTIAAIEPTAIRARGLSLFVPPMFSPSGQSEAIVSQIEFDLSLEGRRIQIDRFTGRAGNLAVAARGDLRLPVARAGRRENPEEAISRGIARYLQTVRTLAAWQHSLSAANAPRLELAFAADETAGARVHVSLFSNRGRLEPSTLPALELKQPIEYSRLQVTTETSLPAAANSELVVDVNLTALSFDRFTAKDLSFQLASQLTVAPIQLKPSTLWSGIQEIDAGVARIQNLKLEADLSQPSEIKATLAGWFAEDAWGIQLIGSPASRSGTARMEGQISTPLIRFASDLAKRNLNAFLVPDAPAPIVVEGTFAEGKLRSAAGRLNSGPVNVRSTRFDGATARFTFRDNFLYVQDIVLTQGESLARGSYEMDVKSLDFRFLLQGQLRPLGISGLFGKWWPNFWNNFDFEAAPPKADVDIQGIWRLPQVVRVFVGVDAAHPRVREVPFSRVRTSLFVRPEYYDALELIADRPEGQARGWFTRTGDNTPAIGNLRFGVTSNLQLQDSARIFGPLGTDIVSPFRFQTPPEITLNGVLESRAAYPRSENVDIRVKSKGPFWFFEFPLSDLECVARVENEVISVSDLAAGFAEGKAVGKARVFGKEPDRRLAFDASVKDATLGHAIQILEEFGAKRRGEAPAPQSKFQQRVAPGKLDLNAKAEGLYQDPYSYVGSGTAELRGAELAQINLLGALSQALRGNSVLGFTSWSLETVQAQFTLEKNILNFSDLVITGPSAKLDAKGQYDLQGKTMRFNAKFYPFEQGKTFLANAVDFVLTPVSAALEMKLAGTLDDPKWYFAFGPTNLLRKLSGADAQKLGEAAAPASGAPPPPPLLLRRK